MQKYIVIIILLSIFLYKGVEGSEGRVKDFSGLQLEVDKLVNRVKTLEEKLSSTQNILQAMKSAEEAISNLTSRLELMEQKLEESSIETMNTLKEAVADLRKKMEEHDITINLLEKEGMTAQKPLKSIKKTIEDQVMAISEIVAQLKEEKEKANSSKEMTEKQMLPSENLSGRLAKILDMFPDLKEEILISNILKTQGYQDVGGGFYVKDITFVPFGLSVEFTGTVMNASGTDQNKADFRIFLYDDKGIFLISHDFSIRDIKKGSAKSFSEIITGIKMEKIGKYALVFGENSEPPQLINLKS